jgi:hypothetical protein
MKQKITQRELKAIRKAIEAIPGRYDTGDTLPVAIALPHDCDNETLQYAHQLIFALRKVNCNANISFILTFPRDLTSHKPYEVLSFIPIATPCIRVYAQQRVLKTTRAKRAGSIIKNWWYALWTNAVTAEASAA